MWQNRGEVLSALILKHFPSHQKFYFRFWKVRKKNKKGNIKWMDCHIKKYWMVDALSHNDTLDACIVTLWIFYEWIVLQWNIGWMHCHIGKYLMNELSHNETLDGCIVTLRDIPWMNCPTTKQCIDAFHIKKYSMNELSYNETLCNSLSNY